MQFLFSTLGHGYIVGGSATTSRVYRTTTAGVFSAWTSLTTSFSTQFQINGVGTLNGVDVFIVGNGGYMYKYDGLTWTRLFPQAPGALYSLSLSSNDEIFVYGAGNFVAKTIDGGTSWSNLTVFTSGSTTISVAARPPHAISMLTSSVVFVGSISGALRQTITSGSTWTDATTLASSSSILTVDIYSSNVGVAGKETITRFIPTS
jgi:photosystem II stability/assembly factor-like uncharacterized protein